MLGKRQRLTHFQAIKKIGKIMKQYTEGDTIFFKPGKPIYTGDRFFFFVILNTRFNFGDFCGQISHFPKSV